MLASVAVFVAGLWTGVALAAIFGALLFTHGEREQQEGIAHE